MWQLSASWIEFAHTHKLEIVNSRSNRSRLMPLQLNNNARCVGPLHEDSSLRSLLELHCNIHLNKVYWIEFAEWKFHLKMKSKRNCRRGKPQSTDRDPDLIGSEIQTSNNFEQSISSQSCAFFHLHSKPNTFRSTSNEWIPLNQFQMWKY